MYLKNPTLVVEAVFIGFEDGVSNLFVGFYAEPDGADSIKVRKTITICPSRECSGIQVILLGKHDAFDSEIRFMDITKHDP